MKYVRSYFATATCGAIFVRHNTTIVTIHQKPFPHNTPTPNTFPQDLHPAFPPVQILPPPEFAPPTPFHAASEGASHPADKPLVPCEGYWSSYLPSISFWSRDDRAHFVHIVSSNIYGYGIQTSFAQKYPPGTYPNHKNLSETFYVLDMEGWKEPLIWAESYIKLMPANLKKPSGSVMPVPSERFYTMIKEFWVKKFGHYSHWPILAPEAYLLGDSGATPYVLGGVPAEGVWTDLVM